MKKLKRILILIPLLLMAFSVLEVVALGELLQKYPRGSFFLADKFPGHQIAGNYDAAGIFEKQLRKCRVDYFDFYLLHNVYEKSIAVYLDPQ